MAAHFLHCMSMAVPAPWRGRLSCVALTAACALRPPSAVRLKRPQPIRPTPAPAICRPRHRRAVARAAGAGASAPSFDNRAVPLDPTPCDLRPAEPGQDSAVQPPLARPRKTAPRSPAWAPRCPAMAAVTPRPAALGCGQGAARTAAGICAGPGERRHPRGPVMVYSGSRGARAPGFPRSADKAGCATATRTGSTATPAARPWRSAT